jgi:hypothetical protein
MTEGKWKNRIESRMIKVSFYYKKRFISIKGACAAPVPALHTIGVTILLVK